MIDKQYEQHRIGSQIAVIRKERGMTQQQLADMTGIQRSQIARIETGRNNSSLAALSAIGAALGKQLNYTEPK